MVLERTPGGRLMGLSFITGVPQNIPAARLTTPNRELSTVGIWRRPMEETTHELWLAELHPAERPRYFDGQLLTANDLREEQDYWRRKLQQHNRFGLGQG